MQGARSLKLGLAAPNTLSLSAVAAAASAFAAGTAQWYLCCLCLCYCFYFHFNFHTFISTIALQPHRQTLCVCSFLSQFRVNCANKKRRKLHQKERLKHLAIGTSLPSSPSLSLSHFLSVCLCLWAPY